jgi:hypothetical protein
MGRKRNVLSRLGILGELLLFFWRRKLWWLIPMIIVLVIFGLLFIFGGSTAIAPFIYTLF